MIEFEAAMDYLWFGMPYECNDWRRDWSDCNAIFDFSVDKLRFVYKNGFVTGYYSNSYSMLTFNMGRASLGDPEFFEKMSEIVKRSLGKGLKDE